ncbi:MAG: hypothetical protein WCD53_19745 [Microcoleus sp.]
MLQKTVRSRLFFHHKYYPPRVSTPSWYKITLKFRKCDRLILQYCSSAVEESAGSRELEQVQNQIEAILNQSDR